MAHLISLLPLDAELHVAALQAVYAATPGYWALYGLDGCPPSQAQADLLAGNETPGRFLLGIVQRVDAADPDGGAELIGVVDFRLSYPEPGLAYVGLLLVAEPYQRQGIGRQAWSLLKPWLAGTAHVERVRVGVEQFNPGCLQFWTSVGLTLTGESNRVEVGGQFVRLLYLEQNIAGAADAPSGAPGGSATQM